MKHSKIILADSCWKPKVPIDMNFINIFDVKYVLLIACLSSYVFDEVQMLRNLETLKLASEAYKLKEGSKIRIDSYANEGGNELKEYMPFRAEVISK